ncbi:MAG: carboxypeptidase-like regulatory domain-containing protein [Vicinamibacterales bacterium]
MRTFAAVFAVAACALTTGCSGSPGARPPLAPTVAPTAVGMRGTVSDTAHRSLAGALIEVLTGPHAGLTTRSGNRGEFSFAGTFDDTSTFGATLDGFAPAVVPLGPYCERCNPNRWAHFALVTLAATTDISGRYVMTIAAGPECVGLPEPARVRTYEVEMPRTADGGGTSTGYVWAKATGAELVAPWDGFQAGVSGTRAGFWYEILAERIAPDAYLFYNVSASATVGVGAPEHIEAAADGRITYCEGADGDFDACFHASSAARVSYCSGRHGVTMVRR